jgi:hypothetical protein
MVTLPFPLAAIPTFSAGAGDDLGRMSRLAPMFLTAAVVTTLVVLCLVARPWVTEMRRTLRLTRGAARRPRGQAQGFSATTLPSRQT